VEWAFGGKDAGQWASVNGRRRIHHREHGGTQRKDEEKKFKSVRYKSAKWKSASATERALT